jgi:hypothetical protein
VQRPRDGERDALGSFERHRLRGQLAEDDVEEGDDREGDGERDGVQRHLGDAPLERLLQKARDHRLADPPQGERRHRDAELRSRDVGVEVVEEAEEPPRGAVAVRGQRLDARAADADQCELRGHEEPVEQDEEED